MPAFSRKQMQLKLLGYSTTDLRDAGFSAAMLRATLQHLVVADERGEDRWSAKPLRPPRGSAGQCVPGVVNVAGCSVRFDS